jgi:hypothetical protein
MRATCRGFRPISKASRVSKSSSFGPSGKLWRRNSLATRVSIGKQSRRLDSREKSGCHAAHIGLLTAIIAAMESDCSPAVTSRWITRPLLAIVGATLLFLGYVLSIGPVYFLWARCSADMATHDKIEGFYSPLLAYGPRWLKRQLTDYRDVSRVAGHQAAQ